MANKKKERKDKKPALWADHVIVADVDTLGAALQYRGPRGNRRLTKPIRLLVEFQKVPHCAIPDGAIAILPGLSSHNQCARALYQASFSSRACACSNGGHSVKPLSKSAPINTLWQHENAITMERD